MSLTLTQSSKYSTPKKHHHKQYAYKSPQSPETTIEEVEQEQDFTFDIKPPRKYFDTPQEKKRYIEEYTKKKKTELCKNYTLVGHCKFGDQCSFAHGEHELTAKTHLHQKYKTKPCKRYFKHGYCCYGNRCQYIHDELKNTNVKEFQKYLNDVYKQQNLPIPVPTNQLKPDERYDIQRFQKMGKRMIKKRFLEQEELIIKGPEFKRLGCFKRLQEERKDNLSCESTSPITSRKTSCNSHEDLQKSKWNANQLIDL